MLSLFRKAEKYDQRIALVDKNKSYTYRDLVEASNNIAYALLETKSDLKEERIGFLIPPSFNYLAVLWGIWKAGGVSVPLSLSATQSELTHCLTDTKINLLISDTRGVKTLKKLADNLNILIMNEKNLKDVSFKSLPKVTLDRRAMILFTSGTTSKPKGVVSTHFNVEAQISSLIKAWGWNKKDFIPLILPLHHIHGIINSLCCPLWVGAKVDILGSFNVEKVVEAVITNKYSVFTAVPTIYFSLLDEFERMKGNKLDLLRKSFKQMRLIMSGSAALSPEIHKQWSDQTGQVLLERYGMTEIGMALSNPLKGERKPGCVGQPLPEVEICLMEDNKIINAEGEAGEIMIKGPQVFLEYWNQEEVTKDSFFKGWFKTGDIAELIDGYYRILGRESVDIIKTGGYKISALEIEDALIKHPLIKECAVVGKKDKKWGEVVATAIVTDQKKLSLNEIQNWSLKLLSEYKIPRKLKVIKKLPKNTMGKVIKSEIKNLF